MDASNRGTPVVNFVLILHIAFLTNYMLVYIQFYPNISVKKWVF